ncbi:MAG: sigma-54-dependent Fis family transcriptional regulator [Phycisphaeraceae bacterium]|nr:sigma-54-dependent Fis family transcriptional regulator [Phycisphaeraceae bacterium]MCW5753314.1 sigma-54-dependent Fis family transcriptional regulator [Phycisphaeraceae bacterium]
MAKLLVIEDEPNLRFAIRQTLVKAGHDVAEAETLAAARTLVREHNYDLILTDVMLGLDNGLDLLQELRADGFEGVAVVMTAHASIEAAVAAMRQGADDYLQKPLSMEELKLQVQRWLEQRRMASRLRLYERLERARDHEQELLGSSQAWKHALAIAERLAHVPIHHPTDAAGDGLPTILLLGETGVGKGVLARYIHACASSTVRKGDTPPFVHVNCAAIPSNLVEGELFGHERGAFTDAKDPRPGLFELADGGTIFLDEIGEMPLELQSKLLLVVEKGVFRRVGGTRERRVAARVIAASNQDLTARCAQGAFRRDLFYRLSAFTLTLPPLRDRQGDAVEIARAMLPRLARRYGRAPLTLSDSSTRAIAAHNWPGNVRELVNAMQRAAMLSTTDIVEPHDLGLAAAPPDPSEGSPTADHAGSDLRFDFTRGTHTAEAVERILMIQALEFTRGNVSKAAKLIGMQRSSFRYRIERYNLENHVKEFSRS